MTINCNGIRDRAKRNKIYAQLKDETGVIFLQETHCDYNSEKFWKWSFNKHDMYWSHGDYKSRGVAIAINKNIDYTYLEISPLLEGRVLFVVIKYELKKLILGNIYAPNLSMIREDQEEYCSFLGKVEKALEAIRERYTDADIILGGGFQYYH